MINPYDKKFMPFLSEDFDIVSPFRSFEDNVKALAESTDISSRQLELELRLLESYKANRVFNRYSNENGKEVFNKETTRIIYVSYRKDYKLYLAFSNGDIRIFDAAPLFEYDVYAPLKNKQNFKGARIKHNTVTWECGISLDIETLYNRSDLFKDRSSHSDKHKHLRLGRTSNLSVDNNTELKEN